MISSGVGKLPSYTMRMCMEQSDLDLLAMVPSQHLQAVLRTRRAPLVAKALNSESDSPTASSSLAPADIAQHLFDLSSLREIITELSEVEQHILRELMACGGRANSRDLALYFSSAGLLVPARKNIDGLDAVEAPLDPSPFVSTPVQYPAAHPHGVFELALRRLLMLGLLFWGRQTNFAGREYSSGIHDGVLIMPLA